MLGSSAALRFRFKRKVRDLTACYRPVQMMVDDIGEIQLVIFFDYEREFGNQRGALTEEAFEEILKTLRQNKVRSTWNCVGRMAEKYPQTIDRLLAEGHDIASHSYSHLIPLLSSKRQLWQDIRRAIELFQRNWGIRLRGFHSPEDAWSHDLVRVLVELGFRYDIAKEKDDGGTTMRWIRGSLTFPGWKGKLLRIPAVSDDWELISAHASKESMLHRWLEYLHPKHVGKCYALGFHPWILGSKTQAMEAFRDFLCHLDAAPHLSIRTGAELAARYWSSSEEVH